MVVVDKADFPGAIAGLQGADRLVVQRAEVDLELASEQEVEVLVTVERRKENFARLQVASAEFLEQSVDAAGRDIPEQLQAPGLLQIGLPPRGVHGAGRLRSRPGNMADITNTPCRMDEYQSARYACGIGLTILGKKL
ncbi:hypothetical protein D3C80_1656610 [compost metagenome]